MKSETGGQQMKLVLGGISAATIVLILLEMAGLIGKLLPKLFFAILMFAYAIQSYREKDTKSAVLQGILGALMLLTLMF
jgi:hypothetical protein